MFWVYFGEGASEESVSLLATYLLSCGCGLWRGKFLRGIGNVFPIGTVSDKDWEFTIFRRDWTVDIAANWEVAVLERYRHFSRILDRLRGQYALREGL